MLPPNRSALLVFLFALSACGGAGRIQEGARSDAAALDSGASESSEDGGRDGGRDRNGGSQDGGEDGADSGAGGGRDASREDLGPEDLGAAEADAGVDAGPADTGSSDAGSVCDNPGTPTTVAPTPSNTAASDFNISLLACTKTAIQIACEVSADHVYTETLGNANRLIEANGIPNHDVGAFPNNTNPNTISVQSRGYRFPLTPSGAGEAIGTTFGVAKSGVVFQPGTAEYWNDGTDWRYEALRYDTAANYFESDSNNHPRELGADCNFAHVDGNGKYHYHGIPTAMMGQAALTHVGWAADGYPIFARYGYTDANDSQSAIKEVTSSYQLKTGARPNDGPPGNYDGTFVQDWEYVQGSGDLDDCNGRTGVITIDGAEVTTYHYYVTNTFPYVPRCFKATPSL